jgi:SOS response regulatory protein OraA/RecX
MTEPKTFQAALQTAQRGDRAAAFQLMRQALIENPNYAPAWFWLSRLVDDPARQRECLDRALALDPHYTPARDDLENLRLRDILSTARSIVAAERTQEPRKIGEYLVEQQVISAAQLKEALAEQNAARNHGQRIPLGDILLRRGWLSPPALASALVKQGQDNLKPQIGLTPERLGEYLVAEKLLSPDQLAAALAEQAQLRQKGKRIALGELLVRNRYLRPEVLARVLEAQRQDFFGRFGH